MPIDYSRYPSNWKTEIVPAVLNRANNRCESCDVKNKQKLFAVRLYVKEDGRYKLRSLWMHEYSDAARIESDPNFIRKIKVVLTVAHLDHDETNHSVQLTRLKALCQMCHLRYDAKEKYRRSLLKWEKQ